MNCHELLLNPLCSPWRRGPLSCISCCRRGWAWRGSARGRTRCFSPPVGMAQHCLFHRKRKEWFQCSIKKLTFHSCFFILNKIDLQRQSWTVSPDFWPLCVFDKYYYYRLVTNKHTVVQKPKSKKYLCLIIRGPDKLVSPKNMNINLVKKIL